MSNSGSSILTSSIELFTQVVFNDVQETYCSLADLNCQFAVSAAVPKGVGDYVGIFPVGWKSVKEHVCSLSVDIPTESQANTDTVLTLKFSTDTLPQNMNEFYQFCYVSSTDQRVRGASSPFQFTIDRSTDWELVDEKESSLFYIPPTEELSGSRQPMAVDGSEEDVKGSEQEVKGSGVGVDGSDRTVKGSSEQGIECSEGGIEGSVRGVRVSEQDVESERGLLDVIIHDVTHQGSADCLLMATDKVHELESAVERLQQELEEAQQELSAKTDELSESSNSLNVLQATLDQYQLQCTTKDAQIAQLNATIENLSLELRELHTVKQQLTESGYEVKQLKEALDRYKQSQNESKQREETLQAQLKSYFATSAAAEGSSIFSQLEVLPTFADGAISVTQTDSDTGDNSQVEVDNSVDTTVNRNSQHSDGQDDDRFEDARDSEPVRTCPICSMQFDSEEADEIIASHIEDHVVKICPICTLEFAPEAQSKYVDHVDSCITASNQQQQQQQRHVL